VSVNPRLGGGSIWSILVAQAEATPNRLFVEAAGARLTYDEAKVGAAWAANSLVALGVVAGDRVAYLSEYRVEMVEWIFGAARIGAVNVALNIYLKGDFLRHQLADCDARVALVDEAGLSSLARIVDDLPALESVVVLDPGPTPSSRAPIVGDLSPLEFVALLGPGPFELKTAAVRLVTRSDLLALAASTADSGRPRVEPSVTAPVALVYTSGTTGRPKACVFDTNYLVRTGLAHGLAWGARDGDVICTATPLYHVAGYVGLMTALMHGSSLVNLSPFSASNYLHRAAATGATIAYGVGFQALALLRRPPSPDDRRHRLRVTWFGPFPPDRADEFEKRFGVTLLSEMYAQSECILTSYRRLGEPASHRTSGAPADDLELRIVGDDDLEALPVGSVGEIAIRALAPGVLFSGYWSDVRSAGPAAPDRWHRTGDLGRLDEAGNLTFVDRKVDSIRRRGEMVSSFELEGALLRHPKIAEAAAYGLRLVDEVDDVIAVAIVLAEGEQVSAVELADFFADELPYYAAPRFVTVVETLPRNASSKVLKAELRQRGVTGDDVWDLHALGLEVERQHRRGAHRRSAP
jgi:carnitine-CoA ligase